MPLARSSRLSGAAAIVGPVTVDLARWRGVTSQYSSRQVCRSASISSKGYHRVLCRTEWLRQICRVIVDTHRREGRPSRATSAEYHGSGPAVARRCADADARRYRPELERCSQLGHAGNVLVDRTRADPVRQRELIWRHRDLSFEVCTAFVRTKDHPTSGALTGIWSNLKINSVI